MAGRSIAALLGTDPPAGPIHTLEAAPLSSAVGGGHDLPWTLRGGDARALGASLHWVVNEIEKKTVPPPAELIEALARTQAKKFVSMELHDLRGKKASFDAKLPDHLATLTEQLRLATTLARAGFYPASGADKPPRTLSTWGFDVPATVASAAAGGDE
jgi:hypothetical protein